MVMKIAAAKHRRVKIMALSRAIFAKNIWQAFFSFVYVQSFVKRVSFGLRESFSATTTFIFSGVYVQITKP